MRVALRIPTRRRERATVVPVRKAHDSGSQHAAAAHALADVEAHQPLEAGNVHAPAHVPGESVRVPSHAMAAARKPMGPCEKTLRPGLRGGHWWIDHRGCIRYGPPPHARLYTGNHAPITHGSRTYVPSYEDVDDPKRVYWAFERAGHQHHGRLHTYHPVSKLEPFRPLTAVYELPHPEHKVQAAERQRQQAHDRSAVLQQFDPGQEPGRDGRPWYTRDDGRKVVFGIPLHLQRSDKDGAVVTWEGKRYKIYGAFMHNGKLVGAAINPDDPMDNNRLYKWSGMVSQRPHWSPMVFGSSRGQRDNAEPFPEVPIEPHSPLPIDSLATSDDAQFRSREVPRLLAWLRNAVPSLSGLEQNKPHYDPDRKRSTDPIEHTGEALSRLDTTGLSDQERMVARLSVVLHDIGKNHMAKHVLHPWISAQMAEPYLDELGLSAGERSRVLRLVAWHDLVGQVAQYQQEHAKGGRRFALAGASHTGELGSTKGMSPEVAGAIVGDHLDDLELLRRIARADVGSIRGLKVDPASLDQAAAAILPHLREVEPGDVARRVEAALPDDLVAPSVLREWLAGHPPPDDAAFEHFVARMLRRDPEARAALVSAVSPPHGALTAGGRQAVEEAQRTWNQLGARGDHSPFHEPVAMVADALRHPDRTRDPYTVAVLRTMETLGVTLPPTIPPPDATTLARAEPIEREWWPLFAHIVTAMEHADASGDWERESSEEWERAEEQYRRRREVVPKTKPEPIRRDPVLRSRHGVVGPLVTDPEQAPSVVERARSGQLDVSIPSNDPRGDRFLEELMRDQGFDGLPALVSSQEMDALEQSGERVLYRGVDTHENALRTAVGPVYGSTGINGNGMYVAFGEGAKEIAQSYGAVVMRFALQPGAVVVPRPVVRRMISYYHPLYYNEWQAAKTRAEDSGSPEDLETARKWELLYNATFDQGQFAALHGIDAIDVHHEPFYIILNRTAVRMERV